MDKIEEHLTCPITLLIFNDPIIAPDGFTYEREALIRHINNSTNPVKSPINRCEFNKNDFDVNSNTNFVIKQLVNTYLEQHPHRKVDQYVLTHDTKNYTVDHSKNIHIYDIFSYNEGYEIINMCYNNITYINLCE